MFTINNPDDDFDDPKAWPNVRYAVWQKERGANGTVHLQGYVSFTKVHSLKMIKKVNLRAHWEVRMGTHQEAKVRREAREIPTAAANRPPAPCTGVLYEGGNPHCWTL